MTGIVFLVFFVCIILAIPLAMSMGFATIVPSLIDPSFSGNLEYVIRAMLKALDTTTILAIPLFMMSGAIMATGGLSKKLFDVFAVFIGKVKGGMPSAVIVTCLFYGAISGSGPATCAAVGAMCIPVLTNLGYEKRFAAALVATAGGLGVIIPPSIPYISYGLVTDTSVGKMFIGGIFPGILIALALILYANIYCRTKGENRGKLRQIEKERRSGRYQRWLLGAVDAGYYSRWYLFWYCHTDGSCLYIRILCYHCVLVHLPDREAEGSAWFSAAGGAVLCPSWYDVRAGAGSFPSADTSGGASDVGFFPGQYH